MSEVPWRRLDPKMLLVHPVSEIGRLALPLLLLVFVGSGGIDGWHVAVVAVPVALGLWRYATTQFRITPEHLELRQGIVGRHVTRARLDRVRTVALDAGPIHRVLSLSKVKIGTGDDARLELNALSTAEARTLRSSLLHRVAPARLPEDGAATLPEVAPEITDDEVLLSFDPRWLLLAPFTGTGLLIAAAALGAGSGPLQEPVGRVLSSASDRVDGVSVLALVAGGALLVGVVLAVLSVVGYALANWGFRFSRDRAGRSWHVARGLLTTTETSIDTSRVRGLALCRPAGLRLVDGGTARALVTGLKEDDDRRSSAGIAPAAPYRVVHEVVRRLAGDDDAVEAPLRAHGPRARRRQLLRPLRGLLWLVLATAVVVLVAELPWWVVPLPLLLAPVAVWLGRDRFAGLGHLLTDHHLVAGEPRVSRHRNLLLRRGIIGWRIERSFFQRRAGLVTLVATTAAGQKKYAIVDLAEDRATGLADVAVPGLVAQFLE